MNIVAHERRMTSNDAPTPHRVANIMGTCFAHDRAAYRCLSINMRLNARAAHRTPSRLFCVTRAFFCSAARFVARTRGIIKHRGDLIATHRARSLRWWRRHHRAVAGRRATHAYHHQRVVGISTFSAVSTRTR